MGRQESIMLYFSLEPKSKDHADYSHITETSPKKKCWEAVDWLYPAQDRFYCWILVCTFHKRRETALRLSRFALLHRTPQSVIALL